MDDFENNDDSVLNKAANQAKEKVKEKAKDEAKKQIKKKMEKEVAKTAAKTAANTATHASAAAAGGPVTLIVIAVIVAIIIAVGIVTFFMTIPGSGMTKLKKYAENIGDAVASFFGADSTKQVKDDEIYGVLDYLENMGYDIKGFGFLDKFTDKSADGTLLDDADDGVIRYTEEDGEDKEGKIKDAESEYIFMYLVSDNYTYTVKNFNLATQSSYHMEFMDKITTFAKGYYARILNNLVRRVTRGLISNLAGDAWGNGMIAIYYEGSHIGERGDFYGNGLHTDPSNILELKWPFELNHISVDAKEKKLKIKKGVFGNEIEYDLEGWAGRYGMPLEFLMAIHSATMMPDLAYDMTLSFKTEVEMLLHDVDGDEDTYQPYISKVTDHWYRDVYYVKKDDVNMVNYDTEYETIMKERWTLYKTYENGNREGEYKLYAINKNGEYATSTSEIRNYDKASSKFSEEDGNYLFDGDDKEANELGLDVAKKAEAVGMTDETLEDYKWKDTDGRWTAFEEENGKIKQVGDALRTETNSKIKKLFLYNTYFRYDGTGDTADAITKFREQEDIPLGALDNKYDLTENTDVLKNTKTTISTENGDEREYAISDISGKIAINQDAQNAFSILENTNTLDSDYIYRDFKELLVEFGYFTKDELREESPRLLEFIVPDIGSYMYPERQIDKSDFEFGTMVHSKGDIDAVEDKKLSAILEMIGDEETDVEDTLDGQSRSNSESSERPSNTSSRASDNPRSTTNPQFGESNGEKTAEEVSIDEFLDTTRAMCEYINKEGYDYCVLGRGSGGNPCVHAIYGNSCHLPIRFADSQTSTSQHNLCCGTLVSWAFQNVKVIPDSMHDDSAAGMAEIIKNYVGAEIIDKGQPLQEGDVLCYPHHIDIVGKEIDGGFEKYNGGHYVNKNAVDYDTYSSINKITGWPDRAEYALRVPWKNSKKEGEKYEGYLGNEAVVSPVTGILLEYGTYGNENESEVKERTNVDLKYGNDLLQLEELEETDRQEVVDKVGYAKILVLDPESYVKLEKSTDNLWKTDSLVTDGKKEYSNDNRVNDKDTIKEWKPINKTVYGYKEFGEDYVESGIAGNIVFIDGFRCEDVDENLEKQFGKRRDPIAKEIPNSGNEITIDSFKITENQLDGDGEERPNLFEPEDEYNALTEEYTQRINNEEYLKEEAASSVVINYDGKDMIFIKEGTVLGRTLTDKELLESDNYRNGSTGTYEENREQIDENSDKIQKVIGNYLRIIFKNSYDVVIENVEDYMKLDDGEDDEIDIDDFLLYYWGPYEAGGWDLPKKGPEQAEDHHNSTSEISTGICQWTNDTNENSGESGEIFKLIGFASQYDSKYSDMEELRPVLQGVPESVSASSAVSQIQEKISKYCAEDRDAFMKMEMELGKYQWVDESVSDIPLEGEVGDRLYEIYPWIKDRPVVVQGSVMSYMARVGQYDICLRNEGVVLTESTSDEEIVSLDTMSKIFKNDGDRAQLQSELANAILTEEITEDDVETWVRQGKLEGYESRFGVRQ